MTVKIKPSHRGLLHKDLGIPEGQTIPMGKIKAAEHSSNPAVRKRAQFADNFHHASVRPRSHKDSAYRK